MVLTLSLAKQQGLWGVIFWQDKGVWFFKSIHVFLFYDWKVCAWQFQCSIWLDVFVCVIPRIFLHELCEQMTSNDVETAKFVCSNKGISRMKLESMKSPQDLFLALEQAQLISPNNLSFLKGDILSVLERDDLMKQILKFEYETGRLEL